MAGYRLLIVDDEKFEREALEFIVRRSGLPIGEIRQAQNGREALAETESAAPDIVFMDIRMPGMDGIDAAREMQSRRPETRIVFLTAFTSFDYAREALRIGADDFLVKPASREQVEEVLARVVERIAAQERRKRERESERRRLELMTDHLEGELVTSFLIGEIDEEQVQEYLALMEMRFSSGIAAILRFDLPESRDDSDGREHRVLHARKLLEDGLTGTRYLVNTIRESLFLIMIPADGNPASEIMRTARRILQEVRRRIAEELGTDVRIGIGEPFGELLRISISFSQARTALARTSAACRVLAYRETSDGGTETGGSARRMDTDALIAALRRGDLQETLRLGEEILDSLIQESESLEALKQLTAGFAESVLTGLPGEISSCFPPASTVEMIEESAGVGEIRLHLRLLLIDLSEAQTDRRSPSGSCRTAAHPTEQACSFLETHFQEDISLEEIASHYGLSMFYFSKLFKQRTGLTFIDYLSRLRIRNAKELLRNPSVSIKEVSARVGYHDPNYFARVFRRIEGASPSEFRDKIVR